MKIISVALPVSLPAELAPESGSRPLYRLAEAVVHRLESAGKTVALAESCTGGMVAKSITDVPGSSNVFSCGIVSYSAGIKEKLLGVRASVIAEHSVVSPEVAAAMASGVRMVGGAHLGIGITGVAGPGPDGTHPEGEIHIALTDGEQTVLGALGPASAGSREKNRQLAAEQALYMIIQYLDGTVCGTVNDKLGG